MMLSSMSRFAVSCAIHCVNKTPVNDTLLFKTLCDKQFNRLLVIISYP